VTGWHFVVLSADTWLILLLTFFKFVTKFFMQFHSTWWY